MKVLIDNSVLVAGMLDQHADHSRALPILSQAKSGQLSAVVSAHSVAEAYSVMTRLPPPLRISPKRARFAIEANVFSCMTIHALSAADYRDLIEHLAQNNLAGGVIFDAVIAWVAMQTQVDQIITFNTKDFRRVVPALSAQVITP